MWSEEQEQLAATVRSFLEQRSPESAVRSTMDTPEGHDPETWRVLSDQIGLTALAIPERFGGAGFGVAELALVFEEMGRALVCAPFFSTTALATSVLLASSDDAMCNEVLPHIASGKTLATVAITEASGRWDEAGIRLPATHGSGGWTLDGTKTYVVDGQVADLIVVAARTSAGVTLFAVDAEAEGLTRNPVAALDLTRKLANLEFRYTPARLVGVEGGGWAAIGHMLNQAAILLACEQVGGAARVLEMAVDYAKVRSQFGRPIGSFQAVKHKCADMLVAVESARTAAYAAVQVAAAGGEDLSAAASLAKAVCSESFTHCATQNIQIHGGIGFTWEHPAHLYYRRAKTSEVLLGSPGHHRQQLAASVDLFSGRDDAFRGVNGRAGSGDADGFRADVRTWLQTTPRPEGLRDYGPTPAPQDVRAGREWQRTLADAGYACLHWPTAFGGRDASVLEQAIFAEEAARAGVPRQINIVGPDMVGPLLMRFGTEAQRRRHLPGIRSGADLWCQLFSEPDAGSDLAAVRTKARADGDGWVVDGQKVWTSAGAGADFGILLARTGGAGHSGLSAFLMPMAAPGVEVRPLRQMDGESKFNEVFLSGVRLEREHLLGELGDGWAVATATLGRERLSLGANTLAMFQALSELVAAASERDHLDPMLRDSVARLWGRIWVLRATWLRAVSGDDLNSPTFSVLKLLTSETQRDLGDLATDALGVDSIVAPEQSPLVARMLVGRAQTILGGTSEIQRNILAERVLGLPRERR